MDYPHAIRLRGLWEYEVLADHSPPSMPPQAPCGVMRVPADWTDTLGAAFRGRVRFRRAFNWPSQLAARERVWLVIEGVDAHGEATLNGQPLGTIDGYALAARFEITPLLAKHNELRVDIACPPVGDEEAARLRPGREKLAGGPIGEVRLEVCSAASIDSLVLYVEPGETPQLHVAGKVTSQEVTGQGEDLDELTLVVNATERELAFQSVSAGQPFRIVASAGLLPPRLTAANEVQSEAVECRLLARGTCLWRGKWRMALPAAMPEEISMQSRNTVRALLPELRKVTRLLVNPRAKRAVECSPWLASREIFDDDVYDSLDRCGVQLVQGIRREWLDRLAPRLAHHPVIAGWAALDSAALDSGAHEPLPFAYGRPYKPAAAWGMEPS